MCNSGQRTSVKWAETAWMTESGWRSELSRLRFIFDINLDIQLYPIDFNKEYYMYSNQAAGSSDVVFRLKF